MGTKAGAHSVHASVLNNAGLQIDFNNTALHGHAHHSQKSHGDNQSATVFTLLPDSLQLQVNDQFNNPVDSAHVNWSAAHGTLSASSSVTDANGVTGIKFTLDQVKGSKSVIDRKSVV